MDKDEMHELPKGWVWTSLEESFDIVLGQSPPSSTYNLNRSGLPFYQGKSEFGNFYPTPKKWCTAPKKISEKGDVLISVRAPVGPTNICSEKSCIGRGLAAIRPLSGIETFFALYLMRAFENIIAGKGTGTTFSAITGDKLKKFHVPIPPLAEQRAIVSKIEQLFSDLDNGIENFKKAQEQLKIYRQAVLKNACEGKLVLTEAELAHAEERNYESADVLLARIKEEYKMSTAGRKNKDMPLLKISHPLMMPDGWLQINFSMLINRIKRGPSKKCNRESRGFRYITSGNLLGGKVRLDFDYKFLEDFDGIDSCRLLPNDLILNCVNSLEQIGKSAIFESRHGDAMVGFNNYALELRTNFINPYYANIFCQSKIFKKQIYFLIKRAVNQVSFATRELDFIDVPLPPLVEQNRIVTEVERRLSICDKMEATIAESLQKAESLRQSILKKAFEGKLLNEKELEEVRSAHDWEPAEKLLERIKAEKTNTKAKKKGKK